MANVYVNSDELKQISQSIKTKSNNIIEAYQNEVSTAISSITETFQISSIDIEQIFNSLNKIFANLNTRINSLADFLINMVANEYDEVYSTMENEFNTKFADEMVKILGTTLTTGNIAEKLIKNNYNKNESDTKIVDKTVKAFGATLTTGVITEELVKNNSKKKELVNNNFEENQIELLDLETEDEILDIPI